MAVVSTWSARSRNKPKWNIVLTGRVQRVTTANGHDVVARTYNFNTYLVADTTSPAAVEANFKNIGGTWDEPFLFPIDPELILPAHRLRLHGRVEYPPNSVFEENTFYGDLLALALDRGFRLADLLGE